MIRVETDPCASVVKMFDERYPELNVSIRLVSQLMQERGFWGIYSHCEEDNSGDIDMDVNAKVSDYVETLIHELCHAVVCQLMDGGEAQHCPKFDEAMEWAHNAWALLQGIDMLDLQGDPVKAVLHMLNITAKELTDMDLVPEGGICTYKTLDDLDKAHIEMHVRVPKKKKDTQDNENVEPVKNPVKIKVPKEGWRVHVEAFKQTGKWYDRGDYFSHKEDFFEIWREITEHQTTGEFAGLVAGACAEKYLIVTIPEHPHNVPQLIFPTERTRNDT